MRGNKKIVWANPAGKNTQPALPHTSRGLPSVVSFFDSLPQGCSKDTFEAAMIPGAMFIVAKGAYLITGVWDGTGADCLSYLSMSRHNPNRSLSVVHNKIGNPIIAIYAGQQRVTEWDGKGWARVMRSMFVIEGSIYAALSAAVLRPA